MANSDYVARNIIRGFCPTAVLAADIAPLATSATMSGFTSPIPEGITLNMAAMIGTEIIVITGRSGNTLTIGRGCCDTIPAAHSTGDRIWFFDASIGNDGVEYGATESLGVKVLPKTGRSTVPIANSPPNGITFNWRYLRPYPPGLMQANATPWFTPQTIDSALPNLVFTWKHRDRVGQLDQLVDHVQDNIGPEAGTTYVARVYKADNTLVRTVTGLTGTTWTYDRDTAKTDFGVTTGVHAGYVIIASVRDTYESWQTYRIDFDLNADDPAPYPPLSTIPVYYKFNGTNNQNTGIDNSGTIVASETSTNYGGTKLTTDDKKYGTASLKRARAFGTDSWTPITDPSLFVGPTGKFTFGFDFRKNGTQPFSNSPPTAGSNVLSMTYVFAGTEGSSSQHYVAFSMKWAWQEAGTGRYVDGEYDFFVSSQSPVFQLRGVEKQPIDSAWHHLEMNLDGANLWIMLDGAVIASFSDLQTASRALGTSKVRMSTGAFIGTADPVADRYLLIDNLYIIPGVCLHTGPFTPPTGELT